MCTHLDDQGAKTHSEAANIILTQIEEKSDKGQLLLFLAGDFNSQQEDDAFLLLTSETSHMKDPRAMISFKTRYGHNDTFTGFGDDQPARVDYLLVHQNPFKWLVSTSPLLRM